MVIQKYLVLHFDFGSDILFKSILGQGTVLYKYIYLRLARVTKRNSREKCTVAFENQVLEIGCLNRIYRDIYKKWYFVSKIVPTYCEKKNVVIQKNENFQKVFKTAFYTIFD